jgi:hypothetical protein
MAALILSAKTMNFDGRRSSMGAKTYDVDLSHGGRKIARKQTEGQEGREAFVWAANLTQGSPSLFNRPFFADRGLTRPARR